MNETPAAPASRRIAAIDVGSNSIRLLIAEASADGRYRILDDEKQTTRLGQGLATTGMISPQAAEQSIAAITRMRTIAAGYGVHLLRVIGTCAVREAINSDEFLSQVRERAGVAVEPIAAAEEAQLAFLSAAHAFDLRGQAVAVVDIGGGSTEIVLSANGVVEAVYSLPLGAVRLTERFGGPEACAGITWKKMRRSIKRQLRETLDEPPFVPQLILGTGGTFTSLANISRSRSLAAASSPGGLPSVRGYELKRSEVLHLAHWLREMPLRTRTRVPGLSPDRADIIVAGVALVERIMKYLGVNRLQVHDGGVRDGLLLTMVRTLFPQELPASTGRDPLQAARRFAATCGYEERHCNHVAFLAGQIFDQVAARFPAEAGGWSDPANRVILESAALLQDVGYLINYARHHQHSYHLIAHSDLPGFTPRQIKLTANIARYHRKASPKRKHSHFAALPATDQEIVRRLSAVLRVADGLDRNRLQNVRGVSLIFEADRVEFLLEAAEEPTVEIWEAERKSGLFEKVFKVKASFAWKRLTETAQSEAGTTSAVTAE